MEPTGLTVKLLQEIREELRGQGSQVHTDFGLLRADFAQMCSDFTTRLEVIEKTAQQMLMLARGINASLGSAAENHEPH